MPDPYGLSRTFSGHHWPVTCVLTVFLMSLRLLAGGLAYPDIRVIAQMFLIQDDPFFAVPPSSAVIRLNDCGDSRCDAPRNPHRMHVYENLLAPRSYFHFCLICSIVRHLLFPYSISLSAQLQPSRVGPQVLYFYVLRMSSPGPNVSNQYGHFKFQV